MMTRASFLRRVLASIGLLTLPSVGEKPKKIFVPDEPVHDLQWYYDNTPNPEMVKSVDPAQNPWDFRMGSRDLGFKYYRKEGEGFVSFDPPPDSYFDEGSGTLQR